VITDKHLKLSQTFVFQHTIVVSQYLCETLQRKTEKFAKKENAFFWSGIRF